MTRVLAALSLLVALSTGCSGPDDAKVTADGDDLVFTWSGAGARLCVMDPNAWCPGDEDDNVTGGKAYWVIDATCFNGGDGFPSPVKYRQLPGCAKDMTTKHGGKAGGEPLVKGNMYRLMITGFGGDPAIQQFTY